jgi:hypothetical protein
MRGAGPRIEKRPQPLTCDSVTRSASFYWVNRQEITEQSAFFVRFGLQLNTQRVERGSATPSTCADALDGISPVRPGKNGRELSKCGRILRTFSIPSSICTIIYSCFMTWVGARLLWWSCTALLLTCPGLCVDTAAQRGVPFSLISSRERRRRVCADFLSF